MSEYKVKNKKLICSFCESSSFSKSEGQLNTKINSFFGLDYLNDSADVFKCNDCGFLMWFLGSDYECLDPDDNYLETKSQPRKSSKGWF